MRKLSAGRRIFLALNTTFIILVGFCCLVPILNLLAKSFSSSQAILENRVRLFPVEFTTNAYSYVFNNGDFWQAVAVTVKRVLVGLPLNLVMTILAAYPLSKSEYQFPERKYYAFFFIFLMIFNGGLIPNYMVVNKLGLMDTPWALVLPCAVPIFNVILMMNFFRGIPEALEESAKLDGASQWIILLKIYLPLSKPSLATVALFSLLNHWNSWFDGLIYSNHTQNYPLQSYLQTLVVNINDLLMQGDIEEVSKLASVNDTNMKAAQIFISIIPLLFIYPFAQKHFTKGMTVGSVKG